MTQRALSILIILLASVAAFASPQVNGTVCHGAGTSCGLTLSVTSGNSAILYAVSTSGTGTTFTVSDSVNTFTALGAVATNSSFNGIIKAYLVTFSVTNASDNIVVTASASSGYMGGMIEQYSGGYTVFDQYAIGSGTSNSLTTAATPTTTANNELLVTGWLFNVASVPTPGTGWAVEQSNTTSIRMMLEDQLVSSPGAYMGTAISTYNPSYAGIIITLQGPVTASTPTFSPAGGNYLGTQSVTTSTSTGSCSSYLYTGTANPPTTLGSTASVSASGTLYSYVHGCPGYADSAVASASYTIGTETQFYSDTLASWYHTDQLDTAQKPLDWFNTQGMWSGDGGAAAPDGTNPANLSVQKDATRGTTCGSGSSQCYEIVSTSSRFGTPSGTSSGTISGAPIALTGYNGVSADQAMQVNLHYNSGAAGAGTRCASGGALTGYIAEAFPSAGVVYFGYYNAGSLTIIHTFSGLTITEGEALKIDSLGTSHTITLGGTVLGTYTDSTLTSGVPCMIASGIGSAYSPTAYYLTGSAPTLKTWSGITTYPAYGAYGFSTATTTVPTVHSMASASPIPGFFYDNGRFACAGNEVSNPEASGTYGLGFTAGAGAGGCSVGAYGIFSPAQWSLITLGQDTIDPTNYFWAIYLYVQHNSHIPGTGTAPNLFDSEEYFIAIQPEYPNSSTPPASVPNETCGPTGEFQGSPYIHLGKVTDQSAAAAVATYGTSVANCYQDKNLSITHIVPMRGDQIMLRYSGGWLTAWCKSGGRSSYVTTPGGVGCPSTSVFTQIASVYDTDLLGHTGEPAIFEQSSASYTTNFAPYTSFQAGSVGNANDPCNTTGACISTTNNVGATQVMW